MASKSGVSDQPFSEEETRQGAINRVLDVLKKCESTPDYIVGLEGGVKDDDMPVNEKDTMKSLMLFAWMAVYAPSTGRWGFGRTGSFYIPPEIVKMVNQGTELGVADDQFFKRVKSGQGSGTVGILTNDLITRGLYYEHALILTLIPFIHPELYP
ncbi:hypothetical protein WA577_004111, partial [Blastocystis sp. JDR]